MKLYLSSYKTGDKKDKLLEYSIKGKIGYVPNALNYPKMTEDRLSALIDRDMSELKALGLECELIDLKTYFHHKDLLEKKIKELGAVFVSGGNVFILRQAMSLSGLDKILIELQNDDSFLYSGYSAAGCVLSKSLRGYDVVDSPNDFPYKSQKETIWNGLGLVDFHFLPHFNSEHSESNDINKELEYCIDNNIPYKTVSDGDVLLVNI